MVYSKDSSNNDVPFLVMTNYTKTLFEEAGSNNYARTLKITLPPLKQGYNILVRENAGIKIIGTALAPLVNQSLVPYQIPPSLLQQRSGIAIDKIDCADGLQLVVKSDENTPACVKPDTVHGLLARGWTSVNDLPSNVICDQNCRYTVEKAGYKCNTGHVAGFYSCYMQNSADIAKVVIPQDISNSESGKYNYEPSKIAVILGINSTVQWQNNDYSSSSVTGDWTMFDSGVIMPEHSWVHVFDRPGIYWYHSVSHPWMRGKVTVLPRDDSYI
ncbi:MAG: cupredoxin domain-containing protein [Nitrosotalea sp.]